MINGVLLIPLDIICIENGSVLHMMNSGSKNFNTFGEIYFSEIDYKKFKGWKLHKKQIQNICVPSGSVRFYLYDARESSTTYLSSQVIELSREKNYKLLVIPNGVWYGFQGLNEPTNLIANMISSPHDPQESIRLPKDSPVVPKFNGYDY
jgi:dTDP-4-dehydrorhamnose 3,5-epimerase